MCLCLLSSVWICPVVEKNFLFVLQTIIWVLRFFRVLEAAASMKSPTSPDVNGLGGL